MSRRERRRARHLRQPGDARAHGIETVYQDLALMDDLDVAINIYIGQFPRKGGCGAVQVRRLGRDYRRAEELLEETLHRPDIDPYKEVEFLSGGQRQLVAVARALAFDPDHVILDEPTSALSVEAADLVHDTIRQLKVDGRSVMGSLP